MNLLTLMNLMKPSKKALLALAVSLVWIASLASSTTALAEGLAINEFLAVNESGLADSDGDRSDWIEIVNEGPGLADLSGCYLSDDAGNLRKWRFPEHASLVLSPGQFRVVFASGKNRLDPAELHASFSLGARGEYLSLTEPDGVTVIHEYAPTYPPQRKDISYGIASDAAPLLGDGSPVSYFVPTNSSLESIWSTPGFAPDGTWSNGSLGLGFARPTDGGGGEPDLGDPISVWPLDASVEDIVGANEGALVGGGSYVEGHDGAPMGALSLNGSSQYVNVSQTTFLPAYNRPAYTVAMWVRGGPQGDRRVWSEGSSSSNTPLFTIGTQAAGSSGQVDIFIRENGGGGPAHRLSVGTAFDNTWHHIAWVDAGGNAALYIDGELDPMDFSYAKQAMSLNVTSIGAVLRGDSCCHFNGEIDDVRVYDRVLSDEEIGSLAAGTGVNVSPYQPWIATDVESALDGVNTSLWARIPFNVDRPADFDTLLLSMRYDDGFVAYLNGVEVARANAPGTPRWNSAATADRVPASAIVAGSFDLSANLGLLVPGANLLAIHGLNRGVSDGDFLLAPELIASGARSFDARYLRTPTPGATNIDSFVDFVDDTTFSVDRGFFDAPFDVEITTMTPGAQIRYTTDGSAPTPTRGTVYSGPLRVTTTTLLRAIAYRSGWEPTNVDTQTYLFLDDVIRQPARPAGLPTTWAGNPADYAMDPEICTDTNSAAYQPSIREDLLAIPTMSIVLDSNDFFGPGRGIYQSPESRGVGWERAASVEMFTHDRRIPEFQVNCGVRVHGGSSARAIEGKHSLRLVFTERHGPAKLRYPLFPGSSVEEFDTVVLRCCSTDSWHFKDGGSRYRRWDSQYIRDVFMRDSQLAMGQLSSAGTHVHLYVNGLYWGLYNPTERPDDSFNTEHQGGAREDWDVIKDFTEVFRGNISAWSQMMSIANSGLSDTATYQRIQGKNPDGSRSDTLPALLDVENLIDYMMLHLWAGAEDWPHHNWYSARNRTDLTGGFRFFVWDQEITIDPAYRDRTEVSNANTPAFLYSRLRANADFRTWFGDRVQKHFFHGGALSVESTRARWMARARELDRAIVGESARWGDFRVDVRDPSNSPAELYTRERHWLPEQTRVINDYLPGSNARALSRFTADGLYPSVPAPEFNQHGGDIEPGFLLVMSAPQGTIYYSLAGTDPRRPGGEIAPDAEVYGVAGLETVLVTGAPARAFVPTSGALGLTWTATDFNDASWIAGTSGVGFERTSGYEDLIGTDLIAQMDGINASCYARFAFTLDATDFDALALRMKYDDGFIAYLNGVEIASRNAPPDATWNSSATGSHSDSEAVVFEEIDVSAHLGLLRMGRNVLALHGMNSSPNSSDMLILPELVVSSLDADATIRLFESTLVKARARADDGWSALQETVFAVDNGLRVTEILYHPQPAGPESLFESDEYEFVELQNTAGATIDLRGVRFVEGIEFDFTESAVTSLAPGEIVVLVENLTAFSERYDLGAILVAGEYTGKLANNGESLHLVGALGETIQRFAYDDTWHPTTDGTGPSLVIVDPQGDRALWSEGAGWRPSNRALGSPGLSEAPSAGGLQKPGDGNQDGNLDVSDAITLLGHLFNGSPVSLPCGNGSVTDPANVMLLDLNGDRTVNLSDPVWLLAYLFQGGPQPVAGSRCIAIEGCANACR